MAKLFTRTFRDKDLQLYCSLSPNYITSFQQFSNAFIQQFENNIGLKIALADFIHCKQGINKK